MHPREFFHFCPRCAAPQRVPAENTFDCASCGFRYYFNAAVAVAVYLSRPDGRVLLIRRAREPSRGMLSPPGGFIDVGETAEEAARRELREEVGLEVHQLEFLASHPNEYFFREVTYPVLDFFFAGRTNAAKVVANAEEVSEILWLPADAVDPSQLAFESMKATWPLFLQR
jgi:NAD+ diphosphatase